MAIKNVDKYIVTNKVFFNTLQVFYFSKLYEKIFTKGKDILKMVLI